MENLQLMESLINNESELVVLGTMLDNQASLKAIDKIDPNIFSTRYNKGLFKAMRAILSDNSKVDIQLVAQAIKKANNPYKTSDLTNLLFYSNKYTFNQHIKLLEELYERRKIYLRASRLASGVLEGEDLNKLLFDFEEALKKDVKASEDKDDIQSIGEAILEDMENPQLDFIKFGIPVLDETIGGIFPGELTTIGAKSGVGKTALALNIVKNILTQDKSVLIITREMTNKHITQRLLTQHVGINTKRMKTHTLEGEDWTKLVAGLSYLSSKKLWINDTISKPSDIRRRVKELKPDVVVVDYLQLLTSEKTNQGREQEVAYLSREMKKLTLDFNCAVIQLTQLNDSYKGIPMGESVVRESRTIYMDSNNVVYIHKPMNIDELLKVAENNENLAKTYLKLNEEGAIKLMQIIVSKCRDGAGKIEKYWYIGEKLTFQPFDQKIE